MTTRNNRKNMNRAKHAGIDKITNNDIKVMQKPLEPIEEAKSRSAAIDSAIDGREEKLTNARNHLVENLRVTADKYRTANGVMAALEIVRQVVGDNLEFSDGIAVAKGLAIQMCERVAKLVEKAESLPIDQMDKICEDMYDADFATKDGSAGDLALELMALNLCQNVGPNAKDIYDFSISSNEEIEKMKVDLEEFCKEHKINLATLSEA